MTTKAKFQTTTKNDSATMSANDSNGANDNQEGDAFSHQGATDAGVARLSGRVVWFSNMKGYGFIKRDDGGADVFVHFSGIQKEGYKTLAENQRVEFEIAESAVHVGRIQAVNCQVIQ